MKKKSARKEWWQSNDTEPPAEYERSYVRALRRMAVTLNCHTPGLSPFSQSVLKKSDQELEELFPKVRIGSVDANAALVNHERIHRDQELEEFDQA